MITTDLTHDEQVKHYEALARQRVAKSPRLSKHEETIFHDWPNWLEHLKWIAFATVRDIEEWAEQIEEDGKG